MAVLVEDFFPYLKLKRFLQEKAVEANKQKEEKRKKGKGLRFFSLFFFLLGGL
jgi:hypothetical protein